MIYQIVFLSHVVAYILAAPTSVVPLEKQQPTVIPIVSQSEELDTNGTYKFSYETANGIKREETSYDKIIPKAASRKANSEEGGESNESDEIHVQRGSYSYTAPDGTIISLSYIADENGFRPIGNHLPRAPTPVQAAPASIEKTGRALKPQDNSESSSAQIPSIQSPYAVPTIAARLGDESKPSESASIETAKQSTISLSQPQDKSENFETTAPGIFKSGQKLDATESATSSPAKPDENETSEMFVTSALQNEHKTETTEAAAVFQPEITPETTESPSASKSGIKSETTEITMVSQSEIKADTTETPAVLQPEIKTETTEILPATESEIKLETTETPVLQPEIKSETTEILAVTEPEIKSETTVIPPVTQSEINTDNTESVTTISNPQSNINAEATEAGSGAVPESKQDDSQPEEDSSNSTQSVSDEQTTDSSNSVETSSSPSNEKTTEPSGEETTLAITVADDTTTEAESSITTAGVTVNEIDETSLANTEITTKATEDAAQDTTELPASTSTVSSNEEVSTSAPSA